MAVSPGARRKSGAVPRDGRAVSVVSDSQDRVHGLRYALPWVAILFITTAFHAYRGAVVDAWVFLAAGVVLGLDLIFRGHGRHAAAPAGSRSPSTAGKKLGSFRLGFAAGSSILVSGVLVLLGNGAAVVVAVVLLGVVMMTLGWPETSKSDNVGKAAVAVRTAAFWWAGILLWLCVWELANFFIGRADIAEAAIFPPLTDLVEPLFTDSSTRWLMVLLWLAACVGLLRVVGRK